MALDFTRPSRPWVSISSSRNVGLLRPSPCAKHRLFDLFFVVGTLPITIIFIAILAAPLMLLFGGNGIFLQTRLGKNGRLFKVIKLRTMDDSGTSVKHPYCAFLRKHSLDELPQLINVLKGDMALVGPRCHVPEMRVGELPVEDIAPNYFERLSVRPGMTGLAQVLGHRGNLDTKMQLRTRIAADLHYILHRSVRNDFKIILRTVRQEVFIGTGI